jgi:poly(3-hydroxyalkanoate) synthetase
VRQLMETYVIELLDQLAEDDMFNVKSILDFDLGYWNADEGPAMCQEVYTQIVKECSDEELLDLYKMVAVEG